MLIIADSGVSLEHSTDAASLLKEILSDASIQASAQSFLTRERVFKERQRKTVCVQQGECARVNLSNEPDVILESNAATTCIIAVAVCKVTGIACIAHLDGASEAAFGQWLRRMTHPSIYLVGDFVLSQGRVRN